MTREGLQKFWVQAYKNAWHVPWSNANSLYTFPTAEGSHEPANEGADILADKAISDPKVGKECCQRTNRAVFTWRKLCREAGKVTYQDRHCTFNNSVRDEGQQRMRCKNMKRSLQVFGDK